MLLRLSEGEEGTALWPTEAEETRRASAEADRARGEAERARSAAALERVAALEALLAVGRGGT